MFMRTTNNEYQPPYLENEEKAEEVKYVFQGYRDTKWQRQIGMMVWVAAESAYYPFQLTYLLSQMCKCV